MKERAQSWAWREGTVDLRETIGGKHDQNYCMKSLKNKHNIKKKKKNSSKPW